MIWVIFTVVILGASLFALWYFNRSDNLDPLARAVKLMRGSAALTPAGAKVYTEVRISTEILSAIDDGLFKCFEKARCQGYDANLNPAKYTICIFKAELTPAGNRAFRVPVNGYRGTKYDQGGYIYAGAMVIPIAREGTNIADNVMAIPDGDAALTRLAVEYEAEHLVLLWNDAQEYEHTKVHGNGGHPIIPDCNSFKVDLRADRLAGGTDYSDCILLEPILENCRNCGAPPTGEADCRYCHTKWGHLEKE